MRILMINSVCGIRSTGRICTDIAEMLEKQGHECKIAYGRETVPEKYQKYAVKIGSDWSVKFDALKTRIFDNAGFNSKLQTKRFVKWIQEYNPDVIHLHNLHGYYLNIEILFSYLKTCGKRIIWTLHDCWAFTGHCAHFDFIGCDNWEKKCHHCPLKKSYPRSLIIDASPRNYNKKKRLFTGLKNMTIVTPSQWLANLVKQSYLKEYPVKVVPNGIDLSVFKPTENDFRSRYNLENKKLILGVATAWGESKGLYDFYKVSKTLNKNYQVVLVGLAEKQIAELPKTILGLPRINNVKELAEIYTSADVFVNLTYNDTYPTVNLEAQACGTPVITYRTGGSAESVFPENALQKGDYRNVCHRIVELCNEDARIIIQRAVSEMVRDYIKLYTECH